MRFWMKWCRCMGELWLECRFEKYDNVLVVSTGLIKRALYRPRSIFNNSNFQYIIEVDFPLDSYRKYIEIAEQTIKRELKDKISTYDKFLHTADQDEIEMGYDSADHEIRTQTHQLYYNSLFISVYSFLEKKMFQILIFYC